MFGVLDVASSTRSLMQAWKRRRGLGAAVQGCSDAVRLEGALLSVTVPAFTANRGRLALFLAIVNKHDEDVEFRMTISKIVRTYKRARQLKHLPLKLERRLTRTTHTQNPNSALPRKLEPREWSKRVSTITRHRRHSHQTKTLRMRTTKCFFTTAFSAQAPYALNLLASLVPGVKYAP